MDYDTYISIKIIIIGDTNVGKSTIFKRIQNKEINMYKEPSTIGMDFARMDYIIDNKGLVLDEQYPYVARTEICKLCKFENT